MKVVTLIGLLILASLVGCKKKKTPTPTPTPDYSVHEPTLVLPARDEICNSGSPIPGTGNSKVSFQWTTDPPTLEVFDLHIKNLNNGDTTMVAGLVFPWSDVPLKSNTPYAWYVVTRSTKISSVATSDIWKFYNSGTGIIEHAPFPADMLTPAFGENVTAVNGKITLAWHGSDVDKNIMDYDVYFDTNSSPSVRFEHVTANQLTDITVKSSTTYYWKVITRDSTKNTSDSGVFQFTVK